MVNWKMGTVVPCAGVILTGGSVDPGLLWGLSVQPSSMWSLAFVGRLLCLWPETAAGCSGFRLLFVYNFFDWVKCLNGF